MNRGGEEATAPVPMPIIEFKVRYLRSGHTKMARNTSRAKRRQAPPGAARRCQTPPGAAKRRQAAF
eukprot:10303415-Lingulodinium_polyedra.AAC.1